MGDELKAGRAARHRDRDVAADADRRTVALNPMLRFAAVRLARLEGREP